MLLYILEVGDCAVQFETIDGLGCLAGVFERDAEVGASGASRFGIVNGVGGVSDLLMSVGVGKSSEVRNRQNLRCSFL